MSAHPVAAARIPCAVCKTPVLTLDAHEAHLEECPVLDAFFIDVDDEIAAAYMYCKCPDLLVCELCCAVCDRRRATAAAVTHREWAVRVHSVTGVVRTVDVDDCDQGDAAEAAYEHVTETAEGRWWRTDIDPTKTEVTPR